MAQVDRDSATTTPPSPPPNLQAAVDEAQAAQVAAEAAQVAAEAAAASINPSVFAVKAKNKFTDAQDFANAVNVASAATVNLNAMTANAGILTGTTTITAWQLSNGANRRLLCPAGIQLTYNATTNNLNTGGANYTTQAGDELEITAYGTVIEVVISRASGLPVTSPTVLNSTNDPTFASTSSTRPTAAEWVNGKLALQPFTKSYSSGEQTITIGGTLTLTHGLGVVPKIVDLKYVCKITEGNYAVNDEPTPYSVAVGGGTWGVQVTNITSTTITLVFGNTSGVSLVNKTTGAWFTGTNANWRLKVDAFA